MAQPEESFVNRYVIQLATSMSWKTYRLIATRADLHALLQAITEALAESSGTIEEGEHGARHQVIWRNYVTQAFVRTDRTQFEVAISEDLEPYHRKGKKQLFEDRASVLVLVALAVVFAIGILTIGYFALRGIDWLLFSHHRV